MWDQDCIESDHQAESQRLPQHSRSSRAEQIRLLIVDDQPVFQEGLSLILAAQSDMLVIGNATTFSGAIEQFRRHRPNVTLLNQCLQGATGSGMQVLTTLKSEFPSACIIVLTTAEGDAEIQRALRAGAASYVLKTTCKSELLETIRSTYRGRRRIPQDVAARLAEHLGTEDLTARELDVLRLIRDGNRNKQIAGRLGIAETTINFHIRNLVGKLQANDRAHAVAIAFRRGLLRV
jgi:DNA-binding NarL/FixJ family response regulator